MVVMMYSVFWWDGDGGMFGLKVERVTVKHKVGDSHQALRFLDCHVCFLTDLGEDGVGL